ncbi:MAG: hypothetical protein ACRC62_15440 [Microcoleus sp.]
MPISNKSRLLYEIQQALQTRGESVQRLGSVAELKELFPGIAKRKLTLENLAALLEEIPTANLDQWRSPNSIRDRRVRSKISHEQIAQWNAIGIKSVAIAAIAGISTQAVGQIVRKQKQVKPK